MAKKAASAAKPAAIDPSKQLVEAIVTVRQLQSFLQQHGGVGQAAEAVDRVQKLVGLTGGFEQLKKALEIVGQEEPAPQA